MNRPEIVLILARGSNGVIGVDGTLPWRIPADLRRFKQLTMDRPMVMGRKTFDSLPGLLPGRRHIVLTRNTNWTADGAEVAGSIGAALLLANAPQVMVIGGAQIYAAFLSLADRIELTEVAAAPAGDTRVDAPDPALWQEIARSDHPADPAANRPAFAFVTLVRRQAA